VRRRECTTCRSGRTIAERDEGKLQKSSGEVAEKPGRNCYREWEKRRGRYCSREVVENAQEGCIKPARDVVDAR
jgi:hypothetical protein